MKTIITIALILCSIGVSAQTRYFKATADYTLRHGCQYSAVYEYWGAPPTYDQLKNRLKTWVKPYKVVQFKITSFEEVKSNKGFRKKKEKFIPCELLAFSYSNLKNVGIADSVIKLTTADSLLKLNDTTNTYKNKP